MAHYIKVLIAIIAMTLPLKAQDSEIESVISGQINAFLLDDFETAYSYAAPSIKRIFPTSEVFGSMVQNGYPMIHRSSTFRFTELREIAGTQYQNVLIQDQSGRFYVAEYAMDLTENGWKIKGVRIFERPEVGA